MRQTPLGPGIQLTIVLVPPQPVAEGQHPFDLVTDSSGAVVPNCKISARNEGTGVVKETTTDVSGNYRVSYLLPGLYQISAEAPNFKRAVQSDVTLDVDHQALVKFTLEVGAVTEKIEVAATTPLLQTQSAEQSQVITEKQMRELPIDVRDFGLSILEFRSWR